MQQFKSLLQKQATILSKRLAPVMVYWKSITPRERVLVISLGGVIVLAFMVYLVTGAMDLRNGLTKDYASLLRYQSSINNMVTTYTLVKNTVPNEFDTVNVDKINSQTTKILDIKLPVQTTLEGNTLTIKVSEVRFDLLLQLLDHLRRTYGIFPTLAEITRLTTSGKVSFYISFKVNNQ